MFATVNTLTVSELDQQTASAGATMLSVVQQIGIGLGIAISSILVNFFRNTFTEAPLQQSFSYTFLSCALFGLALLWLASKLKQSDGGNLH